MAYTPADVTQFTQMQASDPGNAYFQQYGAFPTDQGQQASWFNRAQSGGDQMKDAQAAADTGMNPLMALALIAATVYTGGAAMGAWGGAGAAAGAAGAEALGAGTVADWFTGTAAADFGASGLTAASAAGAGMEGAASWGMGEAFGLPDLTASAMGLSEMAAPAFSTASSMPGFLSRALAGNLGWGDLKTAASLG